MFNNRNRKKSQTVYPIGSVWGGSGYQNQVGINFNKKSRRRSKSKKKNSAYPPTNYIGGMNSSPYGAGDDYIYPPTKNYREHEGGETGVRIAKKYNDDRDYFVYNDFTPYYYEREQVKPKIVSNGEFFEIFDWSDGNEKYKIYTNRWQIIKYMFGAGKCSLLNIDNQTIIPSISTWKIKYSTNNTKMVVHDMLLLDEDDLDELLLGDGRKRKKSTKKVKKKSSLKKKIKSRKH